MSAVLPSQVAFGAPSPAGKPAPGARSGSGDAAAQAWQREMERAQMTQWFKPAPALRGLAPVPVQARQQANPPPALSPAGALGAQAATGPAAGPVVDAGAAPVTTGPQALNGQDAGGPRQPARHAADPAGEEALRDDARTPAPRETAGSAEGPSAPEPGAGALATVSPSSPTGASDKPQAPANTVARLEPRPALPLQPGAAHLPSEPDATTASAAEEASPSGETGPAGAQPLKAQHAPAAAGPVAAFDHLASLQGVRCHAQWSDAGVVNVWLGMDGNQPDQARQLAWIVSELQQSLARQGQALGTVVCNGRTVLEGQARPTDGWDSTPGSPTPPDNDPRPALSGADGI